MTPMEQFVAFLLYAFLFCALAILPFSFFKKLKEEWVSYIRGVFYAKQKYKLLEFRIAKGIARSPLAMELFLNALFQPQGEGNWHDIYVKGSTRSWFSLEIVSIEGTVRFFIWTKDSFVDLIKTQVYGQFPNTEIVDVDSTGEGDYAKKIPYDPSKYSYWCGEFRKKNAGHLPIRTYVDYGLDENPKEEFKVDPITPLLEYMGSLGKGEQAWLQIGVRAPKKDLEKDIPDKETRKKKKIPWYQAKELVDWTDAAADEIKKLTKRDVKIDKEKPANPAEMKMTPMELEKVTAIERSLSKLAFEVSIRAVYLAPKELFMPAHSAAFGGTFKQYNTAHMNMFEVKNPSVKYPWLDKGGFRVEADKKEIFTQYQHRAFFYNEFLPIKGVGKWKTANIKMPNQPFQGTDLGKKEKNFKPFIMTIEELATIYHFPGDIASTPTLTRVEAKKGEPPINLPM
ncbi:MAG: hypothetical protein V4576_02350 [Patescibacteria group bacterium]